MVTITPRNIKLEMQVKDIALIDIILDEIEKIEEKHSVVIELTIRIQ